jgi:hypothetical protein
MPDKMPINTKLESFIEDVKNKIASHKIIKEETSNCNGDLKLENEALCKRIEKLVTSKIQQLPCFSETNKNNTIFSQYLGKRIDAKRSNGLWYHATILGLNPFCVVFDGLDQTESSYDSSRYASFGTHVPIGGEKVNIEGRMAVIQHFDGNTVHLSDGSTCCISRVQR